MKKIIRKTGSSLGIIFNKEEQKILGIKEGDIVDIDDIIVIPKEKEAKKKR